MALDLHGDDEWLRTSTAAEILGVTPRTLWRFVDEDRLSAYTFGDDITRVRAADLLRLRDELGGRL